MTGEAEPRGVVQRAPIPLWRWASWWVMLAVGMFLFYVALTPVWVGLRVLAWAAEFRARRRAPNG